jgi:hypothetical protein
MRRAIIKKILPSPDLYTNSSGSSNGYDLEDYEEVIGTGVMRKDIFLCNFDIAYSRYVLQCTVLYTHLFNKYKYVVFI